MADLMPNTQNAKGSYVQVAAMQYVRKLSEP
jgi:hypothetical protein